MSPRLKESDLTPVHRLVAERVDRGWSVRQAAEEIGVSRMGLARLERGESVHPATLKKIAEFYGYKASDFWNFSENGHAA